MYISTFYGIVPTSNNKFKIFYPVYSNGDINPAGFSSDYSTFSGAVTAVESGYHDLQNALANSQNISLYGMSNILFEQDRYLINQVILEVTASQSSDPDYTNILTSINSNLTNLNTNIVNKNNQSDIVQVIKDCFIENINNVDVSVFKTGSSNDRVKDYGSIPNLLLRIAAHLSSNASYNWTSTVNNDNKILQDISKKLSLENPTDSTIGSTSIRRLLFYFLNIFLRSQSQSTEEVRANSIIKDISDKLANSNDLHTISQAIDLISTAIAQADQSQELGSIKDSIDNLHLEQNNLIQVEGVLDYRLKPTDAE